MQSILFRTVPRPILIISIGGLLLALILAFDLLPFLRGGHGWQWPYDPAPLARALPLILATGIYLAGAWLLLRRTVHAAPLLLWSVLGIVVISLAVVVLRADDVIYELFARTASGLTTGPHIAGAQIDWAGGAWRDWPAVMEAFRETSGHVSLSPPGLPLWYGLLNALLETAPGIAAPLHRALLPYQCQNFTLLAYTPAEWASAWFGVLMPLWAALTVFPLYAVARRLVEPERARWIVIGWPLVPALVMFAASWNTVYPLLSMFAFWLLLIGLERARGAIWIAVSGFVVGLLIFANFSVVPFVGLAGAYVLLNYLWNERRADSPPPWTRPVIAGGWFGLGLILPWLFYGLATGVTPFDMLRVAMGWHLDLDRPYLPWLWLHSWEWALMTGIPFIALWLIGAVNRVRRWRERGPFLGAALLLAMLVLVLSGTARGETGRVWLFFSPFVLIAAVEPHPLTSSPQARRGNNVPQGVGGIYISQAALMIVLAICWPVISVGSDIRPRPASPGGLAVEYSADAVFADSFRLAGWDASADEEAITLRLNWQDIIPVTTPYWFSALLVSPEGEALPEAVVWQPVETRYPATCWASGELIGDVVTLPLPPDAPSGEWWISLAAFADPDQAMDRLSVRLPDGSTDTQVGIGPVIVP